MRSLLDSPSASSLRTLAIAVAAVLVTWLLLGWTPAQTITQGDGSWLVVPYTDGLLHVHGDWTEHLYRFDVLGGSEMHAFGGALPIVQVAAWVGLSTTATVNVVTMFVQVMFGYFGVALVESLGGRPLPPSIKVVAIWLVSFAPLLGWRLTLGHENLLLGFLPLFVVVSLLWQARAGQLTTVSLLLAWFAIFNGVSGMGTQALLYSIVFGTPIVIASLTRRNAIEIVGVLLAGVLVALPRVIPIVAHAFSDDATRTVSTTVTSSYGVAPVSDFLHSILWTIDGRSSGGLHEHDYSLGPSIVIVGYAAWRGIHRRLAVTLLVVLVFVVLFACEVGPIASWLHAIVPPLKAFRGPSRAAMVVVLFVPALALGAWHRLDEPSPDRRVAWGAAAVVAMGILLAAHHGGGWLREILAWVAVTALCVLLHTDRLARVRTIGLILLAGLGVMAFADRLPAGIRRDRIEDGPAQLRAAVIAQMPTSTALDRIGIADPPPPFEMSLAFAARLPSIDGVWYPPKRFVTLLSLLEGHELPPTSSVFRNGGGRRAFPTLQQLYNVRAVIGGLATTQPTVEPLPATPGPAWFPARISVVDDVQQIALRSPRTDAWLLRRERASAPACADARVLRATSDDAAQRVSFDVEARGPCTMIVAANYTSVLRARGDTGALDVFPIDIALTGIVIPEGVSHVVLEPALSIPFAARIAAWLGWLSIAGLIVLRGRERLKAQ